MPDFNPPPPIHTDTDPAPTAAAPDAGDGAAPADAGDEARADEGQALDEVMPVPANEIHTADMIEDFEAESPSAAEALRNEWGADYAHNMGLAFAGIAAAATPDLYAALETAGLANHPALLRAAAAHARALGLPPDGGEPDRMTVAAADPVASIAPNVAPGARPPARLAAVGGWRPGPEDVHDRLAELQSRDDYWRNEVVQRETRALFERVYGTQPVVGSGGRRA